MARVIRSTTTSKVFAVVALVVVALLASVPKWADGSTVRKLFGLFIFVALAQMWNLLAGFAGVVSVGQQAFVGLGAYGMIVFVNNLGLGLYPSILVSALVAAVVSIPLGLIAFRLRGSYFAIGTWVLADVVRLLVQNNTAVGGGSGASIKVTGYKAVVVRQNLYWIALVISVGAVVLTYSLLRSKLGLQLQAIRDNEGGAQGLGTNVYRTRFALWIVVAFVTALAGATYYTNNLRVQPGKAFSVVDWTAPIIFMVVIGGIGSIEGPIIGAVAYWFFRERFSTIPEWYAIVLGLLAIGVALFLQKGVWGLVRKVVDLQLFPVRRRLDLGAEPADS
jgi:branched-chain amino acid transport system permease protein